MISDLTHAIGGRTNGRASEDRTARLVAAAASGDEGAWSCLVKEFGGMIWAIARAHRLSQADAADVSQATWLRLAENLGQLKDPARVGPWLATTARRECLRTLRTAQRYVLAGDDLPEHAATDTALGDVFIAERDEVLWRCFGRLRPSDQALLRLVIASPRLTYDEISAALDMPVGSIGPTRARALERLRHELDREGSLPLLSAA